MKDSTAKDVIIGILTTIIILVVINWFTKTDEINFQILNYRDMNVTLIEQNRELARINTQLHQEVFKISQAAIELSKQVSLTNGKGEIKK